MAIPKPVLILQLRPEDNTADSEFAALLKYGGLEEADVCRIRVEKRGIPELKLDDYSAVIVGGSPFDISTPKEQKSDNQKTVEADFRKLLRDVVENDFPFLGACSGCGLLGDYLATPISTRYSEPVTCVSVELTEDGKSDPLLIGFPDRISVLLGHKEACETTPAGAILLMRGDVCPVQMFRIGNNVYATQFHPEGDSEGFRLRIAAYKDHGYFDPAEAEKLTEIVSQAETPFAQEILRRFVKRYSFNDE